MIICLSQQTNFISDILELASGKGGTQTNRQGSLSACLYSVFGMIAAYSLYYSWGTETILNIMKCYHNINFDLWFLIMVSFTYISLLHFLTNWLSTWAIYKVTQIYASHNFSVAVVQFQNCIFCLNLEMEKKAFEIIQLSEYDSMSLAVCFCWICFRSCEVIYYVMFPIRNIYSYV